MAGWKPRRKMGGILLIGLVFLAVGLISAVEIRRATKPWIAENAMEAERALRYRMWKLGLPQPGAPDPAEYEARLQAAGVKHGAPLFIRVFKEESELEVWMRRESTFVRVTTYPICRWSGALGPKLREGDKQSPEGIYTVARRQLNPNSRWHRSFNIGFPNRFDRALGRTGSFIMVHGGCSSIGCFAITNDLVSELWRTVVAAFDGGQQRFQIQVFPFRPTTSNLMRHATSPHIAFWRDLKPAFDLFERDRVPPAVSVCNARYRIVEGEAGNVGDTPVSEQCPPELVEATPQLDG